MRSVKQPMHVGCLLVRRKLERSETRNNESSFVGVLREFMPLPANNNIRVDVGSDFSQKQDPKNGGSVWKGSIEDPFVRTGIIDFRFHDLRYIFASCDMMKAAIAYKDPRPLEYQEEATLCEAGAATHRENRQHGEGNVEGI